MSRAGTPRRKWLVLIAAPAAVAVWSGWVGLGALCGFGVIHPLPGLPWGLASFRLNTAITLPVGVEAYGAYALGAWVAPGAPEEARKFARRSALGSLALGMAGQVIYHLLAAAHARAAPWPVTVVVSCMPVVTLGFGAALTHMLRGDPAVTGPGDHPVTTSANGNGTGHVTGLSHFPVTGPHDTAVTAPPDGPPVLPRTVTNALPAGNGRTPAPRRPSPTGQDAEREFATELAAGVLPAIRQVRTRMHVNHDNARALHAHLEGVLSRTP